LLDLRRVFWVREKRYFARFSDIETRRAAYFNAAVTVFYGRKGSLGEFREFHINCLETLLPDMQHYFQQRNYPSCSRPLQKPTLSTSTQ
jgi:hypothetical protein